MLLLSLLLLFFSLFCCVRRRRRKLCDGRPVVSRVRRVWVEIDGGRLEGVLLLLLLLLICCRVSSCRPGCWSFCARADLPARSPVKNCVLISARRCTYRRTKQQLLLIMVFNIITSCCCISWRCPITTRPARQQPNYEY